MRVTLLWRGLPCVRLLFYSEFFDLASRVQANIQRRTFPLFLETPKRLPRMIRLVLSQAPQHGVLPVADSRDHSRE